MDVALFVSPLCSAVIAAIGTYVAMSNRLTRLETLISELKDQVEKHNQVVERTYKLESDSETHWKRHDELAARVERLEAR